MSSRGPYRAIQPRGLARPPEREGVQAADAVPWILVAIGGGRTVQAFVTHEVWGAEATIFLCLFVLGALELVGRLIRPGN